jgi:CBS domain-containing protein
MNTSAIRYRVADFLKQYPPFTAMDERDLVALAANGRVRFYEANEFVLWQGEPHKAHVFVIQQGTVSLWDERSGDAELRDVRGAGDLLGVEQFHGARAVLYSVRSTSDVVLYGFSAEDFGTLLTKYPYAAEFVSAIGSVAGDFRPADDRTGPQRMFLHEVASHLQACSDTDRVSDAARMLAHTGAEALAIIAAGSQLAGIVTPGALMSWFADGGRHDDPLSALEVEIPPTVGPDASIADGVIAMGGARADALALTSDGTSTGRLLTLVTPRDLAPVFGDQPAAIIRDIRSAAGADSLRALNQRARACALRFLTSATATDWIARFTTAVDLAILNRLITAKSSYGSSACWCVYDASGRGESIVRRQPGVIVIHDASESTGGLEERYAAVMDDLAACGYLAADSRPPDCSFHVASVREWKRRYSAWIENPVIEDMARNRALLDVRPVYGEPALWRQVRDHVAAAADRDIVRVLAHDCLANLPPLTFYHDAVIEQSGEQTTVFRLEHNVLRPLVDLGRVLGMAARDVMGTSTIDRFGSARRLLPAHESIFRDAAETLRIVLWQQGRVGISEGTDGSVLPPSLLGRHDRHVLKSGFPVIHRLLEFSADPAWLDEI